MHSSNDVPKEIFGQAFGRTDGSPGDEAGAQAGAEASALDDAPELDDQQSRIARLMNPFWIGYERAVAVRDHIESLINTPYSDRITSCAVIAPSYNGKTSILRNVQRRYNKFPSGNSLRSASERAQVKIPVFFVQAPPVPDEDRLLDAVLRQLNILGSPREPAEHKISRLQSVFAGLGVRLLEVDEFGFFQAGSPDRQRKALNGLKYLGNDLRIPIVVASVEEGLNILSSNKEISNRYPALHLPAWGPEEESTLKLLASFEAKLGLKHPSDLGTEEMAKPIVAYSEGILGHMHDLLRLLASRAIKSGAERITIADMRPDALKAAGWILPSQRHQRAR